MFEVSPRSKMTEAERRVFEAAVVFVEREDGFAINLAIELDRAVRAYRESMKTRPRYRVLVVDGDFCVEDIEAAKGLVIADCGRLEDWADRICRLLNQEHS